MASTPRVCSSDMGRLCAANVNRDAAARWRGLLRFVGLRPRAQARREEEAPGRGAFRLADVLLFAAFVLSVVLIGAGGLIIAAGGSLRPAGAALIGLGVLLLVLAVISAASYNAS